MFYSQRFKVEQAEIKQVIKISNCQKLADLKNYDETLQVELPKIFASHLNRPIKQAKNSQNQEENKNNNLIRLRSKKNLVCLRVEDNFFKKVFQPKINYYSIVKMLFPEISGISPLAIDIMDTIFYNSDGSMTYVYTDAKRGLVKTKSKNYVQLFLKRRAEVNEGFKSNLIKISRKQSLNNQNNSFQQPNCFNFQQQNNIFIKNLDYVALLRYKDENFIRIKQHEFKSIFIRPVQANQRYKIFNTLYIQLIPEQVNFIEGTIQNIEFSLEKHKNTQFFKKACQKHCQQTSYNKIGESRQIKERIKQVNVEAYLLFIIFQIYSYVSMHYHKHITSGIFQFMKVNGTYYLSNIRKIKIDDSEDVKNQFQRVDLFNQFTQHEESSSLDKQRLENGILSAVEQLFDKQNKKICQNVQNFIKKKFDQIENIEDAISSNQIFHSINDKYDKNLHYLFENEVQYQKFLKKKQFELDGCSPLTSISNISRKKYKNKKQQKVELEQITRTAKKVQQKCKQNENINYFEVWKAEAINKKQKTNSKWYKQCQGGKRQLYIDKK